MSEEQWRFDMQTSVYEMRQDLDSIKELVKELSALKDLPQILKDMTAALIGKKQVPLEVVMIIIKCLCAIMFVLGIGFVGAQGWFKPILTWIGIS